MPILRWSEFIFSRKKYSYRWEDAPKNDKMRNCWLFITEPCLLGSNELYPKFNVLEVAVWLNNKTWLTKKYDFTVEQYDDAFQEAIKDFNTLKSANTPQLLEDYGCFLLFKQYF
jgi:hypothetical protein